jgi:hypothetical protein
MAKLHRILHHRDTGSFVFPAISDFVRALYRPFLEGFSSHEVVTESIIDGSSTGS